MKQSMVKLSRILIVLVISLSLCTQACIAYAGEKSETEDGGVSIQSDEPAESAVSNESHETGLYKINNQCKYYRNGSFLKVTGIVHNPLDGKMYYVEKGIFARKTGLFKCLDDNEYYYVNKGIVDMKYTGLAKSDVNYYYVKNGKLDRTYTGLAKSDVNYYYVKNGKLDRTYTGLAKSDVNYYYVKNGKLDRSYTGLAKSVANYYYVKDGKLRRDLTGLYDDGKEKVYLYKGKLQSKYTGLVKNDSNHYYVEKGILNNKFSGIVKSVKNSYYVKNGYLDRNYTGLLSEDNNYYYANNGKIETMEILGNPFGDAGFIITYTALTWRICPFHGYELHGGWDLATSNRYAPIYSVSDGTVFFTGRMMGYGNHVVIIKSDDLYILYAHMSNMTVKKGDVLKKGDRIGNQGSEGNSTGPHLHLEFRKQDVKGNTTANLKAIRPMLMAYASNYANKSKEFSRIVR